MRITTVVVVVTALALSLSFTPAECAWVLWTESPEGSDLWTTLRIPQPRFDSAEECHRRAQALNDLEVAFAKMQDAHAHDVFVCFPDTVDPRPEGALLLETTTNPTAPKARE
jgi:hypothetical protein